VPQKAIPSEDCVFLMVCVGIPTDKGVCDKRFYPTLQVVHKLRYCFTCGGFIAKGSYQLQLHLPAADFWDPYCNRHLSAHLEGSVPAGDPSYCGCGDPSHCDCGDPSHCEWERRGSRRPEMVDRSALDPLWSNSRRRLLVGVFRFL